MTNPTAPLSAASADLVKKGQDYYVPNYKPREMILDHGKGARLWDLDGNEYIDFAAGIAVCSLGHQDPDLVAAGEKQLRKLWHTSNVFFTEPPIRLAEALVNSTPFVERVYFCNSGTEANEAAIKLVRKYAADQGKGPEQRNIISFNGSFHGRTLAAVTLTAQPKYQQGYEPLPGGFIYCDTFNDEAAIEKLIDENTCAVFVEPVQGEGGVTPAKAGFLKKLRALCDKVGALLVFDEIQSGMGRTGHLYAFEEDGVEPDIVTLAKGLGGGIPIGAMLVGKKASQTWQFGAHGSTFGGNPIMAAIGLAAITKISQPSLLADVKHKGEWLRAQLTAIGAELDLFKEVRGRGLMIGAELKDAYAGKANDLADAARKAGLLILVAGPNVLRFLPPLTITQEELDEGLKRLKPALAAAKAAIA
jgi:acetylornithine/N-succinyldiaminopimelate aminotransferase